MRKKRTIEEALRWAYRDELPKAGAEWGGAAGVSPMFRLADLGGRVDDWSHEPGMPIVLGPPHPDALVITDAVTALKQVEVDWAGSRGTLAPDCGALVGDDDVTVSAMTIDPIPWVVMHAIQGTRPSGSVEWQVGRRIGRNGKPVVIGRGDRRLSAEGAHCPLDIVPDPREVIADRAIYVVWYAALQRLAATLRESLASFSVTPCEASDAPWLRPDPQSRVLPDLSKPAMWEARRSSRRRRAA